LENFPKSGRKPPKFDRTRYRKILVPPRRLSENRSRSEENLAKFSFFAVGSLFSDSLLVMFSIALRKKKYLFFMSCVAKENYENLFWKLEINNHQLKAGGLELWTVSPDTHQLNDVSHM